MTKSIDQDYHFFREAVYSVSSSLDLSRAMGATFEYMRRHFPIVGLSFHNFVPHRKAMQLLFLKTKDNFYYLDEYVTLDKIGLARMEEVAQRREKTSLVPHSMESPIPRLHGKAISTYLPDKDRGRLVAFLSSKHRIVGHLSLIGPEPECFTPEHERKLAILRPALSLFLVNLLQYRKIDELKNRLAEENRHLAGQVRSLKANNIIGHKGDLKPVMEMVSQLSGQEVPVLITGETGTGKELIADAIQRGSIRHDAPYAKVNCGAIPETLIDSELFGHEKGAFPGAVRTRPGRFEQADGGTLFLDEIGDMPMDAQIRLLRVLQNGVLQRVGGSRNIRVNVRIIAATHQNLKRMIEIHRFREDLFYRLNVFPIKIPPLRDRRKDIVPLAHHFIRRKAKQLGLSRSLRLAKASLTALYDFTWPGNVRQLENIVERALVMDSRNPVQLHLYLPSSGSSSENGRRNRQQGRELPTGGKILPTSGQMIDPSAMALPELLKTAKENLPTLDDAMAEHIKLALQLCNGRIYGPQGAGKLLGINPNTLRKRMDKLGIRYGRNS
jgi:transcriptional regulator with GAF, ATPase, and Fis domain